MKDYTRNTFRVAKETLFSGKVRYVIEVCMDGGIDGWEWHKVNGIEPFETLEKAIKKIQLIRRTEIKSRKSAWVEILNTETNEIVNLPKGLK